MVNLKIGKYTKLVEQATRCSASNGGRDLPTLLNVAVQNSDWISVSIADRILGSCDLDAWTVAVEITDSSVPLDDVSTLRDVMISEETKAKIQAMSENFKGTWKTERTGRTLDLETGGMSATTSNITLGLVLNQLTPEDQELSIADALLFKGLSRDETLCEGDYVKGIIWKLILEKCDPNRGYVVMRKFLIDITKKQLHGTGWSKRINLEHSRERQRVPERSRDLER